jgi:hypothetical protein
MLRILDVRPIFSIGVSILNVRDGTSARASKSIEMAELRDIRETGSECG